MLRAIEDPVSVRSDAVRVDYWRLKTKVGTMKIQVRIDEHQKTGAQMAQREATYQAARLLQREGIECEVIEYFTGSSTTANAAGIILKMPT